MTSLLTLMKNIFNHKLVHIITVPNIEGNDKALSKFLEQTKLKGDYVVLKDNTNGVRVKKKWLL